MASMVFVNTIKQNTAHEVKMSKKIKVFTLSDMPLSPSGVGTQTKYMCEALLNSGKFQIRSFGGAIKHPKYDPIKTEQWGDDWLIFPVDGYGSKEMVRSLIRQEKPDILWFMTDPRFWGWLWEMENEIRSLIPMVYYHVWDNYPYPTFNKQFYESTDLIATISKVTHDIVNTVAPTVKSQYIPHAVHSNIFKPIEDEEALTNFKKEVFGERYDPDKFMFFWNNRNARRKQSGSLIFWFKEFLDKVGHDKACLVMHTETKDPNGQDLERIIQHLNLNQGQVLFSSQKVDPARLAMIYNVADCTINISDAEGFGLATLESLSCATPIIVNKTGGLQEQITDGEKIFGVGIEPVSRAIIGSQQIPWIYEDRLDGSHVVEALETMYSMSKEERMRVGLAGRDHVIKNYNFETFNKTWVDTMTKIHEEEGSWETRKYANRWTLKEIN
jgi:glycosyltransferase involved in cell wall biosynthesis